MRIRISAILGMLAVLTGSYGQNAGDCYRLQSSSELGIPIHPAIGNRNVSYLLTDGDNAKIVTVDTESGWYEVLSG